MGCGAFVLAHSNPFNASVLGGLGGLWNSEEELTAMLQNLPSKEVQMEQGSLAQARLKRTSIGPKLPKNISKLLRASIKKPHQTGRASHHEILVD